MHMASYDEREFFLVERVCALLPPHRCLLPAERSFEQGLHRAGNEEPLLLEGYRVPRCLFPDLSSSRPCRSVSRGNCRSVPRTVSPARHIPTDRAVVAASLLYLPSRQMSVEAQGRPDRADLCGNREF